MVSQTSKPDFLTPSDQAEYTSAFSAPGRMKAGFEVYRAFRKDCKDVQRVEQGGTCFGFRWGKEPFERGELGLWLVQVGSVWVGLIRH
jgi:hypothetical protein